MSKDKQLAKRKLTGPTFGNLVRSIRAIHEKFSAQAGRAVNLSLTLRNWFIGQYIVEYEQNGRDRATYGDLLFQRLAARLQTAGVSRSEERELRRYRQFYQVYPQIRETLTPTFAALLPSRVPGPGIVTTVSPLLEEDQDRIRETPSPEFNLSAKDLITKISFSHIAELLSLAGDARAFYAAECIQGNWSVRELRRQIASLYYERSGLSRDKARLAKQARRGAEKQDIRLAIRDPYIFEFLGLKPREVMGESHLEDQLLDKLQEFLLELGHGFCFEARQKRILIGDTYGFIDLVFYHRILKCHVLLDLKLEEFSHENIGQLNTYVTWYRKHMMTKGDNPPVGILLCAKKDHALAEYALAGMDNRLFVSKYQLHLPKPAQLRRALQRSLKEETEA